MNEAMNAAFSGARIRAMFAVIDARRWDELRGFLHRDVVYSRPGYALMQGIDAVLAFYAHERVIASGTHVLHSVLVDGRHAAAFGRFLGTHRDGSALDEEFADRYETDGAMIVRRQSYFHRPVI